MVAWCIQLYNSIFVTKNKLVSPSPFSPRSGLSWFLSSAGAELEDASGPDQDLILHRFAWHLGLGIWNHILKMSAREKTSMAFHLPLRHPPAIWCMKRWTWASQRPLAHPVLPKGPLGSWSQLVVGFLWVTSGSRRHGDCENKLPDPLRVKCSIFWTGSLRSLLLRWW